MASTVRRSLLKASFSVLFLTSCVMEQPYRSVLTEANGFELEKMFAREPGAYETKVWLLPDGGYVTMCSVRPAGEPYDAVRIVRIDKEGGECWTSTLQRRVGCDLCPTRDGGCVVAAMTYAAWRHRGSTWIPLRVTLTKIDDQGRETWSRVISADSHWKFVSVHQSADGGYSVAGWVLEQETLTPGRNVGDYVYRMCLVKTDEHGETIWSRSFREKEATGISVRQTADGGYAVLGRSFSRSDGSDEEDETISVVRPDAVYVVRTDASGHEIWSRSLGGEGAESSWAFLLTEDGDLVLVGGIESYGSAGRDVYAVALDADGAVKWSRRYSGEGDQEGCSVATTLDGGYVIAGYTDGGNAGTLYPLVIKVDRHGNAVWARVVHASGRNAGLSVMQTNDGGYTLLCADCGVRGVTFGYMGYYDLWLDTWTQRAPRRFALYRLAHE